MCYNSEYYWRKREITNKENTIRSLSVTHTHTKIKFGLDFGTAHELKTSNKEVITNALRDAPLKMSFTSFSSQP